MNRHKHLLHEWCTDCDRELCENSEDIWFDCQTHEPYCTDCYYELWECPECTGRLHECLIVEHLRDTHGWDEADAVEFTENPGQEAVHGTQAP